MIIFIVYKFKKNGFRISRNELVNGFKNNYALFIIAFILLLLSFANVHIMWLNNHLDDGYYLGRISRLTSYQNPYYYNFAVGLDEQHNFNSYLFDVWELEASVYINILRMNVFVGTNCQSFDPSKVQCDKEGNMPIHILDKYCEETDTRYNI